MPTRRTASRGGFTLMEILVALILIGLLVGTLLPSVINQVSKGELNRVNEDLEAVSNAAKAFRVDVQRWPGDLEDLYAQPLATTADTSLTGGQYPAGLAAKWEGPYFELGSIAGDSIVTELGGVILDTFSQTPWGAQSFVTIKVKNVSQEDARELSLRIDGDTITAPATSVGGRVRWKVGTAGADTLIFLGAPVQ